jgi:hypothetical protein
MQLPTPDQVNAVLRHVYTAAGIHNSGNTIWRSSRLQQSGRIDNQTLTVTVQNDTRVTTPVPGLTTLDFSGETTQTLMTNTSYNIKMEAYISSANVFNGDLSLFVWVDPTFRIDPNIPNASQYTIELSPEVGNGLAAVPRKARAPACSGWRWRAAALSLALGGDGADSNLCATQQHRRKSDSDAEVLRTHDWRQFFREVGIVLTPPDAGLLVFPHPITIANRAAINALAARYRLPAIYAYRYFCHRRRPYFLWSGSDRPVARMLRGASIAS